MQPGYVSRRMWCSMEEDDYLRMKVTCLAYILLIWGGFPEFSYGYVQEIEVKVIADNGEIVDHHYHTDDDEEPTLNRYKRAYNPIGGHGEMHFFKYHPQQTYSYDLQSEKQCIAQLKEVRADRKKKGKSIYTQIAAVVDLGDTAMLQCHFCADPTSTTRSAKIWFKTNHGLTAIDRRTYEVKLDMHDDEELNRVYSTADHTLVIKNMSLADAGTYFCEDYDIYSKYIKRLGLIQFDQILAKLATAGGVNNGFSFLYHVDVYLRSDANLLSVSREPGSYLPPPRASEINNKYSYKLYTSWAHWGPCSICGKDKYGERKRRGFCKVSALDKGPAASPVLKKILRMYQSQAPCHSSLFERFTKIVSYPDQVEINKCQTECLSNGRNAKAKKFTAFEDIGDIVVEDGNVDGPEDRVRKHDIKEEEGKNIRLICPGSTLETAVMWQNGSAYLRERNVEEKSHGRLSFDMMDALIIRNLTRYDSGVYSCFYEGRRVAEITLTVPEPPRVPLDDLRKGLGYLWMCYAVYFIIFLACLGVKHRQRLVQIKRKKATSADQDETNSTVEYSQVGSHQ